LTIPGEHFHNVFRVKTINSLPEEKVAPSIPDKCVRTCVIHTYISFQITFSGYKQLAVLLSPHPVVMKMAGVQALRAVPAIFLQHEDGLGANVQSHTCNIPSA